MTSPRALRRLLAVAAAACALSTAAQPAAPAVTPSYRLGPADRVQVKVAETGLDLDLRLSAAGTLTVPLVGEVPAAGLTAAELAAELERLLEADTLVRATVTVEVLEIQSKTVSVLGAVAKPGSYGVPGGWTLLQAIGAAGGLAADRGNTVRIVRHAENGLTDQITLPLAELVDQADPRLDLPVFPDDVIHVERATTVTVYLQGEVAAAGALELPSTQPVTLVTAIARAGGLTERASPRILIKRRGPDGRIFDIPAHYRRILQGEDDDVALQDGDIVVVRESFF